MAFIRMAKGTESNRYFLCQMLFFSFTEKSFLPAAQAELQFAAPSSFSLPEKEERPAGVEEKEGFSLSVCIATPTGTAHLS